MRGGILTLARTSLAHDTSRGRRGVDGLRLVDCRLGGPILLTTLLGHTGAHGQAITVVPHLTTLLGHTGAQGQASTVAAAVGVTTGRSGAQGTVATIAARLSTLTSATGTHGAAASVAARTSAILGATGTHGQDATTNAFLPSSVSGLFLWFNADLETYSDTGLTTPQTSNGGSVKGWKDQAGGNHHATQATGATLATSAVNGQSAIAFANQYLATASITAPTGDFCTFVVWAPNDSNSFSGILTRGAGSGDKNSIYAHSNSTVRYWDGGSHDSTANLSATVFMVTTVQRSGSALSFWKNGTADAVNTITVSGTYNSSDAYGIGADVGGAEGGTKKIAMILAYNAALAGTDRINIHNYLGTYYGITMGGS